MHQRHFSVPRSFYWAKHEQAAQIKRVSPVSWKHVNFYGQYNFLETAGGLDLSALVDWLEAFNGGGKAAN
jgi:hypothetical protein